MHTEQGIYTISGNMYYDTQLGTDKRCSVSDMPTPKTSTECGESEEQLFKLPTSRKGKLSLTIDCFLIFIVLVFIGLIEFGILPHHKSGFNCRDPKLSFEFKGDTISITTLLTTVYVVPLFIICAAESVSSKFTEVCRKTWWWYKEFLLGITIMLVLIEFTKVVVGENRPHFFYTCKPDKAINCTTGYISDYVCTNKQDRSWFVADSSKSFPSGHAALSVFTATFCAWYLQCCLPKLACKLVKPFIQTVCLACSILCSLSRITDHRHHWWDVLAGVILGAVCVLYTITILCRNFKRPTLLPQRSSQSTCTLLTDTTNKNATSVIL